MVLRILPTAQHSDADAQADAVELVVHRGAVVGRGDDGPRGPVPFLDECPEIVAVGVVARGPAIRRRRAGHAVEEVVLLDAGVGRANDGPRTPVPLLDQRLPVIAAETDANGPALRRRCAGHAVEDIRQVAASVG